MALAGSSRGSAGKLFASKDSAGKDSFANNLDINDSLVNGWAGKDLIVKELVLVRLLMSENC